MRLSAGNASDAASTKNATLAVAFLFVTTGSALFDFGNHKKGLDWGPSR